MHLTVILVQILHFVVAVFVQICYDLFGKAVMRMTLLEARTRCHFTQAQAANHLGVSLRSYKSYETDPQKADTLKYRENAEPEFVLQAKDEETLNRLAEGAEVVPDDGEGIVLLSPEGVRVRIVL